MIESGSKQFWRATLALSLGSFMIFTNVYVTHPLLPMLASEFQVSALQAGLSLTLTTLMLGFSLLLFGPLSDAIGRTRLMIGSMCGVVLCSFLLSQVEQFEWLLLLRAVQGVCLAGLPAIAIAYLGDEFSNRALVAAVGIYISGNTLGGIGGRLLGGFIGEWFGWQAAFAITGVLGTLLLTLFVWLLPESRQFKARPLQPKGMLSDIIEHLKNPMLMLAYLIGGLNFFIFINQYSYATFLLSEAPYNLPASLLGMLFLTYLSGTLGSAISGRIAQKMPQPAVIASGVVLMMVGSAVTLTGSIVGIILGFLINAFGFFVAHSSASSWVSHTARHARATASSLYLVFYYLGASTGGFYLDPFWQLAGWNGVIVGSFLVLCVTLSLSLLLLRRKLNFLEPSRAAS